MTDGPPTVKSSARGSASPPRRTYAAFLPAEEPGTQAKAALSGRRTRKGKDTDDLSCSTSRKRPEQATLPGGAGRRRSLPLRSPQNVAPRPPGHPHLRKEQPLFRETSVPGRFFCLSRRLRQSEQLPPPKNRRPSRIPELPARGAPFPHGKRPARKGNEASALALCPDGLMSFPCCGGVPRKRQQGMFSG